MSILEPVVLEPRSTASAPATSRTASFHPRLVGTLACATLSSVALLIAGYHSGIEDDAIYLPGVKKLLDPALYPHDAAFFSGQTNAFLILRAIATSVRVTHIPLGWMQFAWHAASIVLLVLACWYIAGRCFRGFLERFGAVALVSVLLTVPVAGTSLYIADQHFHPRTLATVCILFAIGTALERRYWMSVVCGIAGLLVHPLMAGFGVGYVILLVLPLHRWVGDPQSRPASRAISTVASMVLPFPIILHPNAAWREAALTRSYFFLHRWGWYEWLGIFGPMVLLWWFAKLADKSDSPDLARLCKRLVIYTVLMTFVGLIVGLPAGFDWIAPVQPMRHLQLVYLLMLLAGGGLLVHYVLRNRMTRWGLVFLPLCAGMLFAQRQSFSTSPHIEVPDERTMNRWVRCFIWIRHNTPEGAYFAVDPRYMSKPGEENFGFRALAERSKLADWSKDAAVVAVLPELAPEWKSQIDALEGYENFTREDFLRLRAEYGIDWALVEKPVSGLNCPYDRDGLAVCHIN